MLAQNRQITARHAVETIRQKPVVLYSVSICLALLNAILQRLNFILHMPFFLDTIFTAAGAAIFGMVPGVVTGIATNLLEEAGFGFNGLHWPWGACNAATAVIVAIAVRTGRFRTLGHAVYVSLAVALANTILGAFIATYVYGGTSGSQIDYIVTGLIAIGQSVFTAAFLSRLVANIVDKSIAVFAAFGLYRYLVVTEKT